MRWKTSLRTLPLLTLLSAGLYAAPQPQLVYLQHGRVLRAVLVEPDGAWLTLTLEGGNVVGIPAVLVLQIEPDLSEKASAPSWNMVTSGRYVPTAPRGYDSSQAAAEVEPEPAAEPEAEAPTEVVEPAQLAVPTPAAGARRRGFPRRPTETPDN